MYRGVKSRTPVPSGLWRDQAPSDFFLFGYIKGIPSDYSCESPEDFLNTINEIFIGIDQEVLLSVFESRVNRLNWMIKQEGKHYTQ
jgi:hypothetical protein